MINNKYRINTFYQDFDVGKKYPKYCIEVEDKEIGWAIIAKCLAIDEAEKVVHSCNNIQRIEEERDRLLEQVKDSHKAMDIMLAMLIEAKHKNGEQFLPSKSVVWPTIQRNHQLIQEIEDANR